jgi:membrane protein DedA with SNARE-associated domain
MIRQHATASELGWQDLWAARNRCDQETSLTEQLIAKLGYFGIGLILVLGGLGLPIPEEAPIILAAILSRNGQLWAPAALASCLLGVLLGDLVVYFLGFVYGEKVIGLPIFRRLITRQREAQIKGYFHRHGFKILVSGRFVPGFRTAAYLTAGILKLPTLKLIAIDFLAASLSTLIMFGLGFAFAHQIQSGIREVQQWITLVVALGLASWFLYRFYRARKRAGRPVGPPVLDSDDVPLPLGTSPGLLPPEKGEPEASLSGTGIEKGDSNDTARQVGAAPRPDRGRYADDVKSARTGPASALSGNESVDIDIKAAPPQTSLESR